MNSLSGTSLNVQQILDDFAFLDAWEDRYRYIIELGRALAPLTDEERSEANRVNGCVSQVWLVCETLGRSDDTFLTFRADSDAHIVKGLISLILAAVSKQSKEYILEFDYSSYLGKLGLEGHITPQRSNGLKSMIQRIKEHAAAH